MIQTPSNVIGKDSIAIPNFAVHSTVFREDREALGGGLKEVG